MRDFRSLPDDLPVPIDDKAADHLTGMQVPQVRLPLASGGEVDLREASRDRLVVFIYPRTGTPGMPLIDGWDQIPGARGCTPQSCAYRDRISEFETLGVTLFGLSSQPIGEQSDFQEREGIPYGLLNDSGFALGKDLDLPVFQAGGMELYRRLSFIAVEGEIVKVFYPVFPPDKNAAAVLDWLRSMPKTQSPGF